MTISDISSLASSVAVIATLFFLTIQTRQTNRNQKSLMQQGRTTRMVDIILKHTEPHLSEAISRGIALDMTLDATQVHSMNMFILAIYWSIEDSFLQHKAGLLDDASWATELATLRGLLAGPVGRAAWHINSALASEEYRAFINSIINETKPRAMARDELAEWKTLMAREIAAAA